jgi:hypothetical protein
MQPTRLGEPCVTEQTGQQRPKLTYLLQDTPYTREDMELTFTIAIYDITYVEST